ncbi:nitrogen regulation protein NR(I), partial [Solemya velum gill symbiont]
QEFREDLFHRLNVIRIKLPSLRERREDIPLLMSHFLQSAAEELGEETKELTPEVEELMRSWDWPGNVRQLENTARWITVMAAGNQVHLDDLPPEMREEATSESVYSGDWDEALRQWARVELKRNDAPLLDKALPLFERTLIETALEETGGKKHEAATILGWGRNTLTRKIKELDIES